ncbi:uncharacterized protein LOC120277772 [Dioscorea cayenensis subsp. rotundata]|uniref:Uncharacterized protein LOC120277772 n=1 Tax=Dioscorea cayennensis subsp. rotundata TaxID=55577 RepID=A0AB40CPQ7_DIOCR|nr:uncharacterized protein LOC120277772 [Dioscorea cayenensis subsp. rotundata]
MRTEPYRIKVWYSVFPNNAHPYSPHPSKALAKKFSLAKLHHHPPPRSSGVPVTILYPSPEFSFIGASSPYLLPRQALSPKPLKRSHVGVHIQLEAILIMDLYSLKTVCDVMMSTTKGRSMRSKVEKRMRRETRENLKCKEIAQEINDR